MSAIRQAERHLRALGHDVGKVDGKSDRAFKTALTTYQKAVGLKADGKLTAETAKHLREKREAVGERSDKFLTTGMAGDRVATLERQLKELGHKVGAIDGVFNQKTAEAVKALKASMPRVFENANGVAGARVQRLLNEKVGTGDSTVRATTFNWPSRYRKGGDAADEALFDRLAKGSDVMGLQEFSWASPRITDGEKGWAFHHPDPRGGDKGLTGQALAWRTDKFSLVDKGTTPLSPKTKVQANAAGPTMHREKHIVWAKLRNKETGEVWTMAVVHFVPSKHLGGAAERLWKRQRDTLAKWMRQQGPRTMVMGDFNGQWKDSIARPLRKVANVASAPSHGNRAIDWVLRSKDLKGSGGRASSNAGQSDHRPVHATVRG